MRQGAWSFVRSAVACSLEREAERVLPASGGRRGRKVVCPACCGKDGKRNRLIYMKIDFLFKYIFVLLYFCILIFFLSGRVI